MAKNKLTTPRISLNKLAEFMPAKASRQRQILRDQKYPTEFKGMYHKEAAEAVTQCIASNLENIDPVDKAILILEQATPDKVGAQRRVAANIDALETFKLMLDDVDLKGATPSLGLTSPPRLVVQNVEISVRPEIILRGKGKAGGALVGAMKLHFPRTNPLVGEGPAYVSAVLQEWTKSFLPDDGMPHGPLCFVLDVGSQKAHPGVKATTARMRDVEAVCQNIAALWPTITPGPE